ncbi:MAG TPA: hypothetical protein VJ697_13310 [Nitrososphaeraceae archaeon]|nr:hypothetical protein [Nitrososphaeraceae archaeon]
MTPQGSGVYVFIISQVWSVSANIFPSPSASQSPANSVSRVKPVGVLGLISDTA